MSITNGPNLGLMVNGNQGEAHYSQFMAFLRGIDALVQCKVKSATTAAQPGSPTDGDTYLLPTSSTGAAWAGNDGKIARWCSAASAWEFYTAQNGWETYAQDTGVYWFRVAGAWTAQLKVGNGTASTSTTTGDFVVPGGAGFGGDIFFGGRLKSTANVGALANGDYGFYLNQTIQTIASGSTGGAYLSPNFTGTSPTGLTGYGVRMQASYAWVTPDSACVALGLAARAIVTSPAGSTYANTYAALVEVQATGGATLTNANGIQVNGPVISGGSAVGTAYGVRIQDQKASGASTAYALFVSAQTSGGYSIFTNAGLHSLGDNLDLRGAALVYKVNGTQVLKAQQTGLGTALGAATAGATYTATEQTMLQNAYNKILALETIVRAHGFATT